MTLSIPASTAYDTSQFDDNFPDGIERHFWFKARNDALSRTLGAAERKKWLPPKPSLLEVGCGTGIVLADLRRRGFDISGVELGHPPRRLAPAHMTVGMAAADLPEERRRSVDALLFLDVIEHVPDDIALLRDTLAAFPRSTAVIVTVPARPELWSDHDRSYGHFRRYTRTSLQQTLREAGLEPRSTRYMFRALALAVTLIKGTGRERDPVMRAPAPGPLHPMLAGVLMAEDRLLGGLPIPGLSLIAVATRET